MWVAGKQYAQVVGKDGAIPSHSLCGLRPAEDPEIAFAVIISMENQAEASIPIVRKIVEHYFGGLEVYAFDSSRKEVILND